MSNIERLPEYQWRPYRWVMLIVISFVQIATNFANIQISAAAVTVITTLGLTTAQFGAVSACSFLGGGIFGIAFGGWGDRFGIKRVIGISLIITLIGGVYRIYATSFASLFISMFLIGLSMSALNSNSSKIVRMWFAPSQMSFAMSVYIAMSTVGAVLALSTTPAIMNSHSLTTVYIIGLIAILVATVVWFALAKVKPDGAPEVKEESVMTYISTAAKSPKLWVNAIAMFCIMGAFITCSSFVVATTTMYKGLTDVQAGSLSSISAIVAVPLMIILPAIWTKIGRIKWGVIIQLVLGAVLLIVSWNMEFNVFAMALFILGVSFGGTTIPLMKQYPALLPDVDPKAIGSAGGIHATFQNFGAFFVPSYILGSIVGENMNLIFYGVAAVWVIAAVLMLICPEIGFKGKTNEDIQ